MALIGIDLGTTNTALAFVGEAGVEDFPIEQLVQPGELAHRQVLPSFLYLPAGPEVEAGALALPWDPAPGLVTGGLARRLAEAAPGRGIRSAKSWLCHAGVDRALPAGHCL